MKDKIKSMFEAWKREEEELQQIEQENRVSFAPPTPEDEYNRGKPAFVYQKLSGQWRKVHFNYGEGCPPAGKGQEGDLYVSKAWFL
ncbi:TPA: hypothetical protein ACGU88_000896 [Vibrio vulnificus]|uniref:hypothetical protein n=1 Tax=Vibrio vulnificus TaxID=672 RepID=UPI00289368E4|nr:hypothetical protein [Vibrio vulnificus]WNJ72076.1 hypothetical protein RI132_20290 [Vibrio vulnificus]